METLINLDKAAELFINDLAGRWWWFDGLIKALANDYFLVVGAFLGLLLLWFGTREPKRRDLNQKLALQAMTSMGFSTLAVVALNALFFRPRPFNLVGVTTLLYRPTDSSFPSNSAAVLFGLAFAVWLGNRPAGKVFLSIAVIHSFARLVAGMHYPLDVVGGASIGALAALLTRWLFKVFSAFVDFLLGMARAAFLA